MKPRERLLAALSPEVVEAIEEFIADEVANRLRPDSFLSIPEAANYLSVSEGTIRKFVRQGRLKSKTIGRRRVIRRRDLDSL